MRVHLVQMCSVNDKKKNLDDFLTHLEGVNAQAGDMFFLPENSLFMRGSQAEVVETFDLQGGELEPLQNYCRDKQVFMHLGAIGVRHLEKTYNASVKIFPDGSLEDSYRKIHLFDVEVDGEKLIRESDAFHAGESLNTFKFQGVEFGQTICYDLRFSKLFLAYADLGVDVILVPSSFFYVTGKDHWEVLNRARAIETQCFIIAAAQGGLHAGKQKTWGHSMIVDPWGHIVAEIPNSSDKPQSVLAELDLSLIAKARRQIPLAEHRLRGFSS
tara:strand:+ start:1133 stop:1945 length:813 start_codon:yes stop_codon:yes gene_type:complete